MFIALWHLANDGQNNYCVRGSRQYEQLRERFTQTRLKKNRDKDELRSASRKIKEWCKHNDNPNLGKNTTIMV